MRVGLLAIGLSRREENRCLESRLCSKQRRRLREWALFDSMRAEKGDELIPRDNMPIEAWWRLWSPAYFLDTAAPVQIEPRPVQRQVLLPDGLPRGNP